MHVATAPALRASTPELERLVDMSVDMLCVATTSGFFLVLNPAWSVTLGWSESELRGRRAIDLIHPGDRASALAEARRLAAPGAEIQDFEARFLHADGSVRWLVCSARSDGDRVYAVARDVTRRKHAELAASRAEELLRADHEALRASEQRYRNILETTTEGVWMIDADHRTTYVNRRMAEMLGYTVAEMLGRPVEDFTPVAAEVERAHAGEAREVCYRRRDGTEMWGLLSGTPVTAADGGYGGALAMITDITERRRAEDDLARLAAIVGASPDAIFSIDTEGTITSWNGGAEGLYGYSEEEALGRSAWMLVPPDKTEESRALKPGLMSGGAHWGFRTTALRKDGALIEVEPSVSAIEGPGGRVVGILAIVRAAGD
jgi:PAS domain S-box-containing protein